jgi:hypothetical protein
VSDQLPVVQEKPRVVSRREMAQTLSSALAAGVLFPGLSPLHPIRNHLLNGTLLDSVDEVLGSESHKRLFLSEAQFASLGKITEAIVPGSRKAQSAAVIDLLLSVDAEKSRKGLGDSLAAFETAASQTYHKGVAALSNEELDGLLQAAAARDSSDYAHFENLKGWAVGAYYSSEIGMRELGWTPDRIFSSYPTCTHGESHS